MSCRKDVAIRVANVSKSFKTFKSSRARLAHLTGIGRTLGAPDDPKTDEFIALHEVSFELERGKTFGIMGQNGSGKSTLLQIISGIMAPTAGEVEARGKIAALLELGSGFNPEFTGIENVHLNASILGLSRKEVDDRLQSILDFAEIGDHVHLPVRTYSSGMMLRLAFAVQVAIEPEVLIIDEALAVGDARFQLKCFRKLEELKKRGTTILFVSHATELIKSFCDEALVLNKGRQVYLGDARTATVKYLETIFPEDHVILSDASGPTPLASLAGETDVATLVVSDIAQYSMSTFGVGGAELTVLRIEGIEKPNRLLGGRSIVVTVGFRWEQDAVDAVVNEGKLDPNITLGITFADKRGVYLFGGNGFDRDVQFDYRDQSQATFRFSFVMPHLADEDYFIGVAIAVGSQEQHIQLRWYDCFLPVRCSSEEKNVFGIVGLDYSVENVEKS
ncbi:sugar ABC transporter ATP-binding protein [Rhizobium leguminosarum bv. trifolii CB782]|nr:sugar ABC transporter ATP-binding protein [Rhizobium leguminosarum bv. trifolii CB782]